MVMESILYKRLDIAQVFDKLQDNEKLYAHHMSRAAWLGTRIILRQVSPESSDIVDLIVGLYKSCGGDWDLLLDKESSDAGHEELEKFLQYSVVFLNDMGNYYGQGDQKILPRCSRDFVQHIASTSPATQELASKCLEAMFSENPTRLGFPGPTTQSGYYPPSVGCDEITADEVKAINDFIINKGIGIENTRIRKQQQNGLTIFEVLQASTETDANPTVLGSLTTSASGHNEVRLIRGDHREELLRVNEALLCAQEHCANDKQKAMLLHMHEFFQTGNLELYKESQRIWVKDLGPTVEILFGFLEAYRDPNGSRAEFEGVVALLDPEGSRTLQLLCDRSMEFIAELPWVKGVDGYGKYGPFESDLFEAPEYTAIHALTYSSTMVYLGLNLPNFEDIRQTVGFKNVFIANRHQALERSELLAEENAPFIQSNDRESYLLLYQDMENLNIAIHELLGHGTGKLLTEDTNGKGPNFDVTKPPVNPLTNTAIKTWYKTGETYNGVFGDFATSLEECRAEAVGAFLVFEKELAALFGYTETSQVKLSDLIYNLYLHRGVLGLQALLTYDPESEKWGQAHAQGHFAIFKVLLAADGFMTLVVDEAAKKATVTIDKSKLVSHGRDSIGNLLKQIHIYRCTADVNAANTLYSSLTEITDEWLVVRGIVDLHKPKREVFVQANTVEIDNKVVVLEYEKSARGLIQSWVERYEALDI